VVGKASAVKLLTSPAYRPGVIRAQGLDLAFQSFAQGTRTAEAPQLLGERSPWLRTGLVAYPHLRRALGPLVRRLDAEQVATVKDGVARLTTEGADYSARQVSAEEVLQGAFFDRGYRGLGRELMSSDSADLMRKRIARSEAEASVYEALSLYDDKLADLAIAKRFDAVAMAMQRSANPEYRQMAAWTRPLELPPAAAVNNHPNTVVAPLFSRRWVLSRKTPVWLRGVGSSANPSCSAWASESISRTTAISLSFPTTGERSKSRPSS
jgi:hypothetical protein